MSDPKNIADARRQLNVARAEYLKAKDKKDVRKMERMNTNIFALQEWILAHERR